MSSSRHRFRNRPATLEHLKEQKSLEKGLTAFQIITPFIKILSRFAKQY